MPYLTPEMSPGDKMRAVLADEVWTLTDRGRGETDYIRVFAVANGRIYEVTWHCAQIVESRVEPSRGIPRRGVGLSLALELLGDVARRLGVALDQGRWTEL